MKRYLIALPALVLAGAFAATPSTAMPVAKSAAQQSSAAVEQVGYRKCYWRHGHRQCRWIDDGPSVSIEFGRKHRHHGHRYGHRRGHGHYGHNDSGIRLRVR